MSATTPATLLQTRGERRELGAHVIGACFDQTGRQLAFGLGDGTIHTTRFDGDWTRHEAHDGAVMALSPDALPDGFLSAGDDGVLLRVSAGGTLSPLYKTGGKWVEQVVSFADPRAGLIACAVGKHAHLFTASGKLIKSLPHPSSVTGLCFDAKGKRLVASHYNGASLWYTASKSDNPRLLDWKGSHIGVVMHPAGEAVVTAMQENALHGWRLTDSQHMRMTGYPAKTESMGFTRNGKYLASSGADSIVLWPFFGGGPMGKPPLELGQIEGILCTRVACHPKDELVAAGYADGTVVVIQIGTQRAVVIADATGVPVSALAWSPDGARLAFGTEGGMAASINLG